MRRRLKTIGLGLLIAVFVSGAPSVSIAAPAPEWTCYWQILWYDEELNPVYGYDCYWVD